MTDARTLRKKLNWPQHKLAAYLGCSQPTVWRMEHVQRPSGAHKILLAALERDFEEGRVTSAPARTRRRKNSHPDRKLSAQDGGETGERPEQGSAASAVTVGERQDSRASRPSRHSWGVEGDNPIFPPRLDVMKLLEG